MSMKVEENNGRYRATCSLCNWKSPVYSQQKDAVRDFSLHRNKPSHQIKEKKYKAKGANSTSMKKGTTYTVMAASSGYPNVGGPVKQIVASSPAEAKRKYLEKYPDKDPSLIRVKRQIS